MAASLFTALSQTPAISDLATTDDGHQVYFRLNGTFGVAGVYQLDGFQPNERRLSAYRLDSDYSFLDQRISGPSLSGDGQTVLVNSAWRCRSTFFCGAAPTGNRSYLHQWGDPRELALEGVSSLSRNGRFVFHASPDSQALSHLYDRTTNTDTQTSIPLRGFRNGVSDDGDVVGRAWFTIGGLALSSPNRETRNLTIEEIVTDASINSIGTHIAYTASPSGAWLYHIASDSRVLLDARATKVSLSNDGNRLVYVSGGSVFLHDRITRQTTQLFSRTDVVEAVIAGRGNVVIAATAHATVYRIDLDPVRVSEIHSALRVEAPAVVARGSWALIRGGPFFRTEILGRVQVERPGLLRAPTELMGVRVSIGFRPAPIVALGPDWMLVFVPNATPLGPVPVLVSTPSVPGGVAATTTVAVTAPAFLRTNYPRLPESDTYAIAHQGFQGSVVAETSPARSDEIVHLYATGLGPVDQNVPDATWDFLLPLPRVATPLNCTLDGLFVEGSAYLAPWNVGLYQVDVRLPRITSARSARLACMGATAIIPVAP